MQSIRHNADNNNLEWVTLVDNVLSNIDTDNVSEETVNALRALLRVVNEHGFTEGVGDPNDLHPNASTGELFMEFNNDQFDSLLAIWRVFRGFVAGGNPGTPLAVTGSTARLQFLNNAALTSLGAGDRRATNPEVNFSVTYQGNELEYAGLERFGGSQWFLWVDKSRDWVIGDFPVSFTMTPDDGTAAASLRQAHSNINTSQVVFDGETIMEVSYVTYNRIGGPAVVGDKTYTFASSTADISLQNVPADDQPADWRKVTSLSPIYTDEDPNEEYIGSQPYRSTGDNPSYVYHGGQHELGHLNNTKWQLVNGREFVIEPGQEYRADRKMKTVSEDWGNQYYHMSYTFDETNNRAIATLNYANNNLTLTDVTANSLYDATADVTWALDSRCWAFIS